MNNNPPADDIRLSDSAPRADYAPPADDAIPIDDTLPLDNAVPADNSAPAPAPPSPVPQPQSTVPHDELLAPTSPLTDLSRLSMSPDLARAEVIPTFETPKLARHSSRQTKPIERFSASASDLPRRRSTTSRTPAPTLGAKSNSPQERPTPSKRRQSLAKDPQHSRQDSKGEPKSRAPSQSHSQAQPQGETEDASLRLARELAGYEFGLRNRGR